MTAEPPLSLEQRNAAAARITALSVTVAATLAVLKIGVWWVSGSVAILASAADSTLDLAASLITFFVVRFAAKGPDAEHRFGHGKAEAFASLLQGALVLVSAALVGREAVQRLLQPEAPSHETWAVAVMAVSILLTGGLVLAQSRVLKRTRSVAVKGDRAHYAADLASNVASLIGVAAAAFLGILWADPVAGLVVCGWLVWGAIGVFREAADHLMDRELPDEDRERVRSLILQSDPAVLGVHQLRTRSSGAYLHIQAHVDMNPSLTLDSAHRILVAAERRVLEAFPTADILLHPDPEDQAEPHGGPFGESPVEPRAAAPDSAR